MSGWQGLYGKTSSAAWLVGIPDMLLYFSKSCSLERGLQSKCACARHLQTCQSSLAAEVSLHSMQVACGRPFYWLYLVASIAKFFPLSLTQSVYMQVSMPFANETITFGWIASPEGRGTADILLSCLFTILLCCWTTICPNLPGLGEGRWAQFRDKFDLACIGLLGPEFLFVIAMGQRTSARRSVRVCCSKPCRLYY